MAAGGLEAATVSAIADAAHVAVGSIYAHFSGKEALVLEVFLDRAEPALRNFMTQSAQIAPERRLQEAGEALIRFAVEEPALTAALVSGRLLGVSDAAEGPRQRVLDLAEEYVRLLRRDLQAALSDRAAPRDEVASALLTFWLGLMSAISRSDAFAISGERAAELLRCQLQAMKFLQ